MNPPPPPPPSSSSSQPPHLSLSRFGPASTQAFPEGAAMRSFLPAGGNPPPPDHTASAGPYGCGGDISLGHQLDGEEERDAGAAARSPAVFFSNLMMDVGSKAAAGSSSTEAHPTIPNSNRKMQSHLLGATLSHISEDGFTDLLRRGDHPVDEASNGHAAMARSFSGGFSIRPWDDSNTVAFALPPSSSAGRRSKDSNGDIIAALSSYDQTQFSMAGTSLEMAGVEKYLVQMQQEQVPFKVRAKRGCATHPRSIAERERRTRISEKLRKLQDLVPNMDKQTSTADMLDLALGHIKGLQTQLQALKQEQERCTCCSKQARN